MLRNLLRIGKDILLRLSTLRMCCDQFDMTRVFARPVLGFDRCLSGLRCESHLIRSNLPTDLLFKLWNGFFVFNVNYLLQNNYIAITEVPFSKWILNSSYTTVCMQQ
jgi:hypothetical protein